MPRVLWFFLVVCLSAGAEGTSPLCLACPCNSPPPYPPKVNCDRIPIDIFNKSYWLDDAGSPYNITSLSYRNVHLNLSGPFFPSPLKLLDLSNNSLREIGKEVFKNLVDLHVLILAWNELDQLHPDVFKGSYDKDKYYPLQSLWQLELSHNRIHSLGYDLFQHLDSLAVLKLDHNPLQVVDSAMVQSISSVGGLESLDLSYTLLSDLPENFLFVPFYLEELNLSGNNFTRIPKALSKSQNLGTLHLDNNPVVNLSGENIFPLVRKLTTLHMSSMPLLEYIGPEALGNLLSLREVHLSHCPRLRFVDQAAFSKGSYQIKLQKVYVSDNRLECWESNTVGLKSLTEVNFSGNPWKCECMSLLNIQIPILDWYGHPSEIKGLPLDVRCEHIEVKSTLTVVAGLAVALALVVVLGYIVYTTFCRKRKSRLTYTHPGYLPINA